MKCNITIEKDIKKKFHALAVEYEVSLSDLISKVLEKCYNRKDIIEEAVKELKNEL